MQTIKNITLDTQKEEKKIRIYAKQGDQGSRFICITVTADGKPLAIHPDMRARLRCLRRDGFIVLTDATVMENGTILAQIPDQALTMPGAVMADMTLLDRDGSFLSTMVFTIVVRRTPQETA